jgi:hypothetical protein
MLPGMAAAAGGALDVAHAGMMVRMIWVTPWRTMLVSSGAGTAVWASTSTSGFAAGMWMPPHLAAMYLFLVRMLLHAPRLSRYRILVIPPPAWRLSTPMRLADAVRCLLGGSWRSVHLRVSYTLGFFYAFITLAFNLSGPAWATATMFLVSVILVALSPQSPVGRAGGASSGARTATPPAAVAAATCGTAGTPVTNCTGTLTSSGAIGDLGRGGSPARPATSYSTRRTVHAVPYADLVPRRHGARLSALVVAVDNCCLAWAEASSPIGEEGGRGGGTSEEAPGA